MIGQDRGYIENRYLDYWNKTNHDRPLISVYSNRRGATFSSMPTPRNTEDIWFDIDFIIARARHIFNTTFYGGEAFPLIYPNLGPDILGAICGCGLQFGTDTSWAVHNVSDWRSLPKLEFSLDNEWFVKLQKITMALLEDAGDDYIVGVTDLHPGTDGLVSLRGPEKLCIDLFDEPEEIKSRIDEMFAVYKTVLVEQNKLIRTVQKPSTNWMGILHPEKEWYVTSSDFSALISREQFDEFVVPGLCNELDFLPASIYHLDGAGALHHLDRLLSLNKLDGIQWVQGAGAPPAREWIHVYKQIQEAGKLIAAHCEPEDIRPLCESLRPEGVHLTCYAQNETQAAELTELALTVCNKKR